jgi:hypothetical protein
VFGRSGTVFLKLEKEKPNRDREKKEDPPGEGWVGVIGTMAVRGGWGRAE